MSYPEIPNDFSRQNTDAEARRRLMAENSQISQGDYQSPYDRKWGFIFGIIGSVIGFPAYVIKEIVNAHLRCLRDTSPMSPFSVLSDPLHLPYYCDQHRVIVSSVVVSVLSIIIGIAGWIIYSRLQKR